MPYKDSNKQREFQRIWIKQRREEFFKNKCCVKCGSHDKLELDHIEPEKKTSHRIWSWAAGKREAEILKCQVLCHDCHVEKTKQDMRWYLKHGTNTAYRNYSCRCDICKKAHNDASNEYRWRTGRRKKRA